MARAFVGLPEDFTGRCEVLETKPDGTTHCGAIEKAMSSDGPMKLWATFHIDGNCPSPELRKEICATVHP